MQAEKRLELKHVCMDDKMTDRLWMDRLRNEVQEGVDLQVLKLQRSRE